MVEILGAYYCTLEVNKDIKEGYFQRLYLFQHQKLIHYLLYPYLWIYINLSNISLTQYRKLPRKIQLFNAFI